LSLLAQDEIAHLRARNEGQNQKVESKEEGLARRAALYDRLINQHTSLLYDRNSGHTFGAGSGMKGEEERRDLLSPTSVVDFTFRRGASQLLQMREGQNFNSAAATTFKSRPASRGIIVEPEVGDSKIEDGPAVPRNSSTFPPLLLKSILKKSSAGIQKYSSCDEAQAATERRGVEWNSDQMRGFRSTR